MLDQLEVSNHVPEVLGHDDTVEDMREELQFGLDTAGPDPLLTPCSWLDRWAGRHESRPSGPRAAPADD